MFIVTFNKSSKGSFFHWRLSSGAKQNHLSVRPHIFIILIYVSLVGITISAVVYNKKNSC